MTSPNADQLSQLRELAERNYDDVLIGDLQDGIRSLLTALAAAEKREKVLICEECDGLGFYEEDGRQHSCKVCDGDPRIDFATVKEYAKQIDDLLAGQTKNLASYDRAVTDGIRAENRLIAELQEVRLKFVAAESALSTERERVIEECCETIRKRLPITPTCVTSADADEIIAMLRALRSPEVAPKERK